jgi:hypothetical protein
MKTATLKQAGKVIQMIIDKETPDEQLQWLFESGAFPDLLDANPNGFDREVFRKVLGLKPLNPPVSVEPQPEPAPLPMSIVIDGDLNPNVPSGLYLTGEGTEHRKMGKVTLEKREDGKLYANGKEVVLDLSPNQQNGKTIQGHKLRKELKNKQILNACIMDALRANTQLIPEDWKQDEQGRTRYIFFWGTIFRHAGGDLYVGCLCWGGGQWDWLCDWLGSDWGGQNPAASLAN